MFSPKSLRERALSLSPFRRRRAQAREPAASKTVPLLPQINIGPDINTKTPNDDMNGTAWSYEDALKTAPPAAAPQTPVRAMPAYSTPRHASGPLAVDTSASNGDPNYAAATTSSWNRANPHATPNNSKTSQYIDKITSENERLRRELRAEKLAREDEAKRVSAAQSKAEDSRAEHQHLQVLADANSRAIERKDRKIEELKAALDGEVARRQAAELRADEALRMLGDTRSETQRQLAAAQEMRHHADASAEAAKDTYRRLSETYQQQLKVSQKEILALQRERQEDADNIKRQAIISDQLSREVTKSLRSAHSMTDLMGRYKKEHEKQVDALVEEATALKLVLPAKEEEADNLAEQMKAARDQMKWVMAQQKRLGGS